MRMRGGRSGAQEVVTREADETSADGIAEAPGTAFTQRPTGDERLSAAKRAATQTGRLRPFQLGCLALLTVQNVVLSQCLGVIGKLQKEKYSVAVLQLHSEIVKFVVSGAVLCAQEPASLQASTFASRAAMPMAVPAALYFVQNCLGLFAFKSVSVPVLAVGCAHRAARDGKSADKSSQLTTQQRSLKALSHEHGLSPDALHNGGNDAAFTLQVMLSQCRVRFEAPPRTPSKHAMQTDFQEKQAVATAAAGVLNDLISVLEDAERPPEHKALIEQVAEFAKVLASGAAVIDPQVGVPELRFPPTLSALERKLVHEAAAKCALTSASQGVGADRYIAVRAGGASFPPGATKFSRKRAGKEARSGGSGAKRRGLTGLSDRATEAAEAQ